MVLISSSYRGKMSRRVETRNAFLGLTEYQEQSAVLCGPQSISHHLKWRFIPVTIPLIVSHLVLINAHYRLFPFAPLTLISTVFWHINNMADHQRLVTDLMLCTK